MGSVARICPRNDLTTAADDVYAYTCDVSDRREVMKVAETIRAEVRALLRFSPLCTYQV